MIESMQSLGMDNFRVAYTRFLAFYSDNPSGLHDGETPAKWQSKANFANLAKIVCFAKWVKGA